MVIVVGRRLLYPNGVILRCFYGRVVCGGDIKDQVMDWYGGGRQTVLIWECPVYPGWFLEGLGVYVFNWC